jgi:4-amino-4-deoxy-L-arabinose transferase-like glycosyltransferase
MHLSAGLQVLSEHRFGIHLHNPPMPRVVIAFAPWLAGARWDPAHASMEQITTMFFALGDYKRMLVLARMGTIVFFVIAVVFTTLLARRQIGAAGALLTAFFFTTQPTILGHSGLATVDIAGTAGFAVALVAFSLWLARPTWRNVLIVGLAYGFSINCKFLCIAYVPIACGAVYAVALISDDAPRRMWRRSFALLTVPFVGFILVWAGYGFSIGRYGTLLVPAPLFWRGLFDMMAVNRAGFASYAFGHVSTSGWWWYFPAALGLKSPIAFLLLVLAGALFARRSVLPSIAAAAASLALAMDTHVDIGVRYILPIFVPLSIIAAGGALAMLRDGRRVVRAAAVVLIAWYAVSTTIAHPDYLAYFNEIGGRDPSRYLVDSNLDWGQDLLRLRAALRKRHVERVGVALMGTANCSRLGYPPNGALSPWSPSKGWVAVSDHIYRMEGASGGFRWLDPYKYVRVGKSIRLIYIP